MFSLAKWSKENSCFPDLAENTDYHYYETEIELLRGWLRFWKSAYPHYITGWNVENFDIPYLVNRITTVLGDARELSPCRDVIEHTINTKYGTEKTYDIVGIAVLDYLELYKNTRSLHVNLTLWTSLQKRNYRSTKRNLQELMVLSFGIIHKAFRIIISRTSIL